jgi:hypothetical protein
LTREDRGGGEKINRTPHPDHLPRSGERRKGKDLTAPLTFILSRREREESKKFSSRASSPLTGEDRGGGEKVNGTPHFNSLPQGREKKFYLIKSILFVFTNFGAFKV